MSLIKDIAKNLTKLNRIYLLCILSDVYAIARFAW